MPGLHIKQEVIHEAYRAAPAVGGTAAAFSLNDWNEIIALCVGVATFIYITVQIFYLLHKYTWAIKDRRNGVHKKKPRKRK